MAERSNVPRGKPQPDVFLAVARALQVAPARCLVFEDSRVGAGAARVLPSWHEGTCADVFAPIL